MIRQLRSRRQWRRWNDGTMTTLLMLDIRYKRVAVLVTRMRREPQVRML
jgi:hypothetical protein